MSEIIGWAEVAPQLYGQTILCSTVLNNKIYAGTNPDGLLFEYNGSDSWVQVADTLDGQLSIYSLAVYNSKLYGVTLPDGYLFEWDGVDEWDKVTNLIGTIIGVPRLVVHDNKLYLILSGSLYQWNDIDDWVFICTTPATSINSAISYDGSLYIGTSDGRLYEWDGVSAWNVVAIKLLNQTSIVSLLEYNSLIYAGTYDGGRLFRWNGSNRWEQLAGELSSQTGVMCLCEYNGYLYGGTYPNGMLFKWNGDEYYGSWIQVAGQLDDNTVIYGLHCINERIYGTSDKGKLLTGAIEFDVSASDNVILADSSKRYDSIKLSDSLPLISSLKKRFSRFPFSSLAIFTDNLLKKIKLYKFSEIDLDAAIDHIVMLKNLSDFVITEDDINKQIKLIRNLHVPVTDEPSKSVIKEFSELIHISEYNFKSVNKIKDFGTSIEDVNVRSINKVNNQPVTISEHTSRSVSVSKNGYLSVYDSNSKLINKSEVNFEAGVSDELSKSLQKVFTDSILPVDYPLKSLLKNISDDIPVDRTIRPVTWEDLAGETWEDLDGETWESLGWVDSPSNLVKTVIKPRDESMPLFMRICYKVANFIGDSSLDAFIFIDNLNKYLGIYKFDYIDINSVLENLKILILVAENLYTTDSIIKSTSKMQVDNITILDHLIKNIPKYLNDSSILTDALSKVFSNIKADNISLSDSILQKMIEKKPKELLIILESLFRLFSMGILLEDNISITDQFNRLKRIFASDGLSISDLVSKELIKSIIDILSTQDSIVKKESRKILNTPVALYDAVKKQVNKLLHSDEEVKDDLLNVKFPGVYARQRKEPIIKEPIDEEWHDITSIQRRGPKGR